MEEVEGGRRPVVVRLEVVLLLEVRAVLSHDRDGPRTNSSISKKDIRGVVLLDLRGDVRGCQVAEQLVEVGGRHIKHLRL